MKIDGTGLIATALRAQADASRPGYIFARGVSNSMEIDEAQYERELTTLSFVLHACDEPLWYISSTTADVALTRYGQHKAECEQLVAEHGGRSIRLANVVGNGGHPNQLVPSLVRQIKSGLVTVQHGATRDIIDVEDAARFILLATRPAQAKPLTTIASGVSTPVSELVDWMCRLLGLKPGVFLVAGGDAQKVDVPAFGAAYPFQVLKSYVR